MNGVYEEVKQCRICLGQSFATILNLGSLHINAFPKPDEPDTPKVPLEVIRCNTCGLCQLRHITNPDALWKGQYWYASKISSQMRSVLKTLVNETLKRVQLTRDDVVLDIGANDGFTLECYPDWVNKVAVEPSDYANEINVPTCRVVKDYFNLQNPVIASLEGKCKIVTTIAMLYDVDDLREFIRGVDYVLKDDGTWVIQVAYLPDILKNNAYDGTVHEHVSLFDLRSLRRVLREYGFDIYDAERVAVNEGSVRLWVRKAKANPGLKPSIAVRQLIIKEASLPRRLASWQRRVDKSRKQLRAFVEDEVSRGNIVALLGASTKANTVLQYCGFTNKEIAYASERQPSKFGRVTVGSRIPILSDEEARKRTPDVFLVGPWQFRSQLIENEREYLNIGGRLAFPLPNFEVVTSDNA